MLVLKTALSLQVFYCSSSSLSEMCGCHVGVSYEVDSFRNNLSKDDAGFQNVKVALWLSAMFTRAKYSDKACVEQVKSKILRWIVGLQQR